MVVESAVPQSRITGMCFTSDGSTLATVSAEGGLFLWSISEKPPFLALNFRAPDDAGRIYAGNISSLVISADSTLIACAGGEELIRLWNRQGRDRRMIVRPRGLYAGMNIVDVTGITEAQKASLRALGATG
jgi:WD40 repeat protein